MSLGFEQAGFDVAAAVEVDPIHCAVHHFNFPQCTIIPRNIGSVTGSEIRQVANLSNQAIDCVFGGPPCQGFSLIGHRALDDPRNALVRDFVRLVAELDARTFVFENVKGLTVGRHKAFLEELVREFDSVGYSVRLPWRVLDAAYYGFHSAANASYSLVPELSDSGVSRPDLRASGRSGAWPARRPHVRRCA